jgi:hypothetical protein
MRVFHCGKAKLQCVGFQIEIEENKTPGDELISIRQALNC